MKVIRFDDGKYGVLVRMDVHDRYFLSMRGDECYFSLPHLVNKHCKTRFKWVAKRRRRLALCGGTS